MSLNVLVIPEDFRTDQLILRPVLKKMFSELGKSQARIYFCQEFVGGVDQALNWDLIGEIIELNPDVHIFLLIVDRDGDMHRARRLTRIEALAADKLPPTKTLIGENAWQEIEVWALAGQDLPSNWSWQEIRGEVHPKERYFLPLSAARNLSDEPAAGRGILGEEAASQYRRVRSRCPEDIQQLETRLKDWLAAN